MGKSYTVALLCAFSFLHLALQAPPTVDYSFSATLASKAGNDSAVVRILVDYPNKYSLVQRLDQDQLSFNLSRCDGEVIVLEYKPATNSCHVGCWKGSSCTPGISCACALNNIFNFLYRSSLNGSCSVDGKLGNLWVYKEHEITWSYCLQGTDSPVPLSVTINGNIEVSFIFYSWTPGPPEDDVFEIPFYCTCGKGISDTQNNGNSIIGSFLEKLKKH